MWKSPWTDLENQNLLWDIAAKIILEGVRGRKRVRAIETWFGDFKLSVLHNKTEDAHMNNAQPRNCTLQSAAVLNILHCLLGQTARLGLRGNCIVSVTNALSHRDGREEEALSECHRICRLAQRVFSVNGNSLEGLQAIDLNSWWMDVVTWPDAWTELMVLF